MKFSYDIGWLPNYVEYDELFSNFKSSGIDTLAFNFFCLNDIDTVLSPDKFVSNAEQICAAADRAGVCFNQSYAPFSLKLCDERLNRFEPAYGTLVRALQFSAGLRVKQMICYAIQTPDTMSQTDKNFKLYRSLIPYCEKYGIKIAISSGFPKYIDSSVLKTPWKTADEYVAFISSFNSPFITACADLGGSDMDAANELITKVGKDKLSAINFKDPDKYHDVHLPPYFKHAKPEIVRKMLCDMGYEGEFTFECPAFVQRYPKVLLSNLFALFYDIGCYVCGTKEEKR